MHVRLRETTPGRQTPAAAALAEPELLALQRTAGNQAVVRMLARDATPSRLDVAPVTELYKGGTSAEAWRDAVRSREHFVDLYSELATLLNATKIEDVKGITAKDINTARKPEPGALRHEGQHRGARQSRAVHHPVPVRGRADADKLAHPAYPELEDTARFWVHNDTAVRQEIVARLKALRTRLSTDRQTAFDAAMNKLKADDKANAPLSDAVLK